VKQIVQNYKEGTLSIEEVAEPSLRSGGMLVQTYHSIISAGTEKMKIDDSKRSFIGMAKARPEKVKQVIETYKQQGPLATYRKVMNRLDSMTPLGYSLAGRVIAVAKDVTEFQVGDMVACAGADIANHAEINWVPVNLCCKIPRVKNGVQGDENGYLPTDIASTATVGSIAMQGVRQAEVSVGENVAVIGLGLIGLLSALILKASGCNVLGIDIDHKKVDLAKKLGIDEACTTSSADIEQLALSFSSGYGMDAVLVTTGTTSNEPILMAGRIARDRATIVDIGINKMDIPWQLYFDKELVLKQSRSYGPGRYDLNYEMKGQDYPIGYVRWTEKRNMISFLDLLANGEINIYPLITHRFNFNEAAEAYSLIEGDKSQFYVGIILKYDISDNNLIKSRIKIIQQDIIKSVDNMNLGMIGAGNFARTMLLPHLKSKDINLAGIATATGISAKDTARKFGFAVSTTDYSELLKNDSINTIMIATRHNLHGKLVVESLKSGKHVYSEKPLCINEDELSEILSCYNELSSAGKAPLVMVGFNRRYAPMIIKMKEFFTPRKEPIVINYRVNAGFIKKTDWYQDKNIGGGRIIGEVCHFIDTFQFMTDALPKSVFAQTIKSGNQAITEEDNVIITIRFSDGSIGSITYIANGDPKFSKEYIEIFCENKVAVMDNFSKLTTMKKGTKKVTKAAIQDKGHKHEMKTLVDAVCGNRQVPVSFESLYFTTLASIKILESINKNEVIELK
jgi:predicted dehydrogenase